ncbi:SRPBCC family protein [Chitinophaga deserti]|uniref:SRPBCC family protein n=1 Tax=Chitinophaga deserti TaxID=2164099 RepID=UPI000D6C2A5B|nr:SRPBCC family protein [Chitinophaga deserti]
METTKQAITITSTIQQPAAKVWELWNEPEHITQWCAASDDWHAPKASSDLRAGGAFSTTMAAKDGSFSFDFGGVFDVVEPHQRIEYTLGDGRKVKIDFKEENGQTQVVETFDPEETNPEDMQRAGWQAILDNFKRYAESK